MAKPHRLPTDDIHDGDASRPTGEPDPAPTDVEPLCPPGGDTEAGDATHQIGEPDQVSADVEPSLPRHRPLNFNVVHIPVDDIVVVGDRRAVNEDFLAVLTEDIERFGLRTPITVRSRQKVVDPKTGAVRDSAHPLVTGLHRLEACRMLGRRDIPAYVRDCSELEAQLWEITENLIRAELTADEKIEHAHRLAIVIRKMEESLEESDFPKKDDQAAVRRGVCPQRSTRPPDGPGPHRAVLPGVHALPQ